MAEAYRRGEGPRDRRPRRRREGQGGRPAYARSVVDRYQYLLLMGACLALTAPLELLYGARVWRDPRRLARTLAVPAAVFAVWDVLAIRAGVWDFSPRYVTGWLLPFDLPVEEAAFFLTIPICSILAYEAVTRSLAARARRRGGPPARSGAGAVGADG